jgi:hypothetical protein
VTDVFISYAHEDQAFVANVARALEAEGFSVWWDHTIPPGRTWETFIARGITEARCCIVVWSPHSIASDWVKEEATLAKDGGKYLPVSIGDEQPPMGFRRIQAAQLRGWAGDRANGQWQLLVGEVRALVGGERTARPAVPEPLAPRQPDSPSTPAAAPPSRTNWTLIGGISVAAAAALGILFFAVGQLDRSSQSSADVAASVAPYEAATSTEAPAPVSDASLRVSDVLGVWTVVGGSGCVGDQRFVLHGSNMSWDWHDGSTWSENAQSNGPYALDHNTLYINGRAILERRADGFWIVSQGPGGNYNCHVELTSTTTSAPPTVNADPADRFVGTWRMVTGDCDENRIRRGANGLEVAYASSSRWVPLRIESPTRARATDIEWTYDLVGDRLRWTGVGGSGQCEFTRAG